MRLSEWVSETMDTYLLLPGQMNPSEDGSRDSDREEGDLEYELDHFESSPRFDPR